MELHKLTPAAKRKKSKRIGRGNASSGTYSGRGMKGQKSRSGAKIKPGFEGGRTSLVKQTPKRRGFKSIRIKPVILNVSKLNDKFKDGDIVDNKSLAEKSLIPNNSARVKILGNGELKIKLSVAVSKVSKSAKKKIEDVKGTVIVAKESLPSSKKDNQEKDDGKSKSN